MTAVIRAGEGRRLSLPGRTSIELVSAAEGGYGVTVRRVTIPPETGHTSQPPPGHQAGPPPGRGPHRHQGCEEVILIVDGTGEFVAGGSVSPVGPGDVVVVSPGEPHYTRNTGSGDLVSLCFFPVPDLAAVSTEQPGPAR
jgi:mannose-6-phosphate isomerase-like protein (cupin superfamily)